MLPTLPPSSFNGYLAKCWTQLQLGHRIAVYKCLVPVTGSIKTAVYLSQLLYWYRHGVAVKENDGWIFKSIAKTEEETGLTKREQGVCKARLLELGLIETERRGMGANLALRVNLNAVAAAVLQQIGSGEEIDLTLDDWRAGQHPILRKHFSKHIVYHRDAVRLTGCIHCAIMLSFLLHQCVLKHKDDKHYLYGNYTIEQWQDYVCLPYRAQLTARSKLRARGIIFEKHFSISRRVYTLINAPKVLDLLGELYQGSETQNNADDNAAPDIASKENKTNPATEDTTGEKTVQNRTEPVKALQDNEHREVTKVKIHSLQKGIWGSDRSVYSDKKAEVTEVYIHSLQKGEWGSNRSVSSPENKDLALIKEVEKLQKWKLQNRKLRSDKSANKEVTKAQIIIGRDYKEFTNVNNYKLY